MNQFVTLVVGGLFLGSIYSLVALGFVTVFKATQVINFAQGSVLLLGAYVIARAHDSIGFWPAVLAGILAAAVAAVLIDVVFIRRVREADLGTLAILTLGIDILLLTELTRRIGTDVLNIGAPWGSDVVELARDPDPGLARDRGRRGDGARRGLLGGVQVHRLGHRDALGRRGRRDRVADGHPAQPRRRRRRGRWPARWRRSAGCS